MKKNFWTARLKTILIVAVVLAVVVAVILGITSGATFGENVVGTLLSPLRTGVAAIDRQAERYYNYIFGYEALKAENEELQKKILLKNSVLMWYGRLQSYLRLVFRNLLKMICLI